MFARSRFAPLAVLAPLILAASPSAPERLAAPPLPGFHVGHEAANSEQSLREEIPSGETVQNWTRMVTTQRFGDVATRPTPTQFLANIARSLAAACPGARTSQPVVSDRGGYASAQFRADCPLLASTNKPETFFLLAIAGREDLHVKQVAFRGVPTRADTQWGEGFLRGVTLCEADDARAVCTS